jgi:hypothetical protein
MKASKGKCVCLIIALLLVADELIASTTDLISSALDASREQAIYWLQYQFSLEAASIEHSLEHFGAGYVEFCGILTWFLLLGLRRVCSVASSLALVDGTRVSLSISEIWFFCAGGCFDRRRFLLNLVVIQEDRRRGLFSCCSVLQHLTSPWNDEDGNGVEPAFGVAGIARYGDGI